MRFQSTTTAGAAAGLSLAAASLTAAANPLHTLMLLTASVAIAALGLMAKDCPINCPGTGPTGQRKDPSNPVWQHLALFITAVALMATLSACIRANPAHSPANPTAPAYIVNPALSDARTDAAGLAAVAAQITGTGPTIPLATSAFFAVVTALSLAWARHKSKAADTIAEGVIAAGTVATQAVLANADGSPKYSAVASLLAKATPPPPPPTPPGP